MDEECREWAFHFLTQKGYKCWVSDAGDLMAGWGDKVVFVTARKYHNWRTYDEALSWLKVVADPCEKEGLLICFNSEFDSLFITRTEMVSDNLCDYSFYRRIMDFIWVEFSVFA